MPTDRKHLLEEYRSLRESAFNALKTLLENGDVESYSFSDGSGSQNVRRRRIGELKELLEEYDKEIDEMEKEARGGGIMTFGTGRYGRQG